MDAENLVDQLFELHAAAPRVEGLLGTPAGEAAADQFKAAVDETKAAVIEHIGDDHPMVVLVAAFGEQAAAKLLHDLMSGTLVSAAVAAKFELREPFASVFSKWLIEHSDKTAKLEDCLASIVMLRPKTGAS